MTPFIVLAVVAVIGIIVVVQILLKDSKNQGLAIEELTPEDLTDDGIVNLTHLGPKKEESSLNSASSSTATKPKNLNDIYASPSGGAPSQPSSPPSQKKGGLFGAFSKKKDPFEIPEVTPLPSLKEYIELEEKRQKKNPDQAASSSRQTGTASLKASPSSSLEPLSAEEEKKIEKEINLSFELTELKEKFSQLDRLFKEKSEELEKTGKSLESELKNSKEFNKVKDLLEKELKDSKDKNKSVKADLTAAQMESDSYKKRIGQLDEKVTKLEKEFLAKEKEVDNLVKRLQTFASSATSTVPPKKEPVVAEAPVAEATVSAEPVIEPAPAAEPEPPPAPEILIPVNQEQPEPPKEEKPIQEKMPDTQFTETPPPPEEEHKEVPFLKLPPDPLSQIVIESIQNPPSTEPVVHKENTPSPPLNSTDEIRPAHGLS